VNCQQGEEGENVMMLENINYNYCITPMPQTLALMTSLDPKPSRDSKDKYSKTQSKQNEK